MSDDDIKEFAYQAGHFFLVEFGTASASMDWLRKFANLVAAREREACAKVCDDWPNGRDDVCLLADAIRARGKK